MNDGYNFPSEPMEGQEPVVPVQAEAQQEQAEVITLSREAMIDELHAWCKEFVGKSKAWRLSNWESDWRKWQRNSDSIFDEQLAKKKEAWQSKAFWPITAAYRENAQAQLFRTEVGPNPAIAVKARPGIVDSRIPGADQSENIRDLVLREREKSEYEVNRDKVLEDKTTYGSGFAQVFFDTTIEDRMVWEQDLEPVLPPEVDGGASVQRSAMGQLQVVGRHQTIKPQIIYRGVCFRHISIWDVFPDPMALTIKNNAVAIRYNQTYEQILEGAKPDADGKPGYVMLEAIAKLKDIPSEETTPVDKQDVQSDRLRSDQPVKRTEQGRILECYEIQARLPKKWVLINGEDIDNPEALIPAVVRFHAATVICVHPSPSYDGQPNIYKDDYQPVAGQLYGRGIPEMVKDSQAVANEAVNQRLDSGTVALLNVYAVIEKSVVDSKDFEMGPGSVIRFKAKDGLTNIDQLFKKIDMGTIDRNSFIEPQEWERAAQERTSITQTTLGSEDNTNTTLGAQQIQQGVTGAKIAYIGMLSEFGFQREIFKAYWKNIYQNYNPDDYILALGQERGSQVQPMTPEQLENSYQYYPLGIYEMQGKNQRMAGLAAWDAQFGQMPWANRLELAKEQLRSMDQESDKFIVAEADAIQITMKAQEMAQGMAQQMVQQIPPKSNHDDKGEAEGADSMPGQGGME